MKFNRNNLIKSSSPYLLQHGTNPVWWQEWSKEVVEYAVQEKKPLFVSSGYSTCHWCHVMASEAFSDRETADFLNSHYVCIKIDREQRPDIDQYLMDFISSQNGSGGWPLNVFLTSDLRPVYALTYAPVKSRNSYPSFLSVAQKVFEFIEEHKADIPQFHPDVNFPPKSRETDMIKIICGYYDSENAGFGRGQKFPSHSTLLYLLYLLSVEGNINVKEICLNTLDTMQLKGLNDHLQGGIFRYCVDSEWTIPHFEKMLYDQAMALWVYSLAFRITGSQSYKQMSEDILLCLEDSFMENGVYVSAHDADTGHKEGATYLWSYEELEKALTPDELISFSETYIIGKKGNFEGSNHLIRKNDNQIKDIENKLLAIRKVRLQPSRDNKILCGINALTAISFINAGRYLARPDLEEKAATLIHNLIRLFWDGKSLGHSLFKGILQKQSFLFDSSAMLVAITMLYENDKSWGEIMNTFLIYVRSFKDEEVWIESRADDFPCVSAALFDHPVPSSISLAEMGLARAMILKDEVMPSIEYRQPLQSDFYNIQCLISNGLFHIFTSKEFIPWSLLPANSLQKRGEPETDCYAGMCRLL
jgi:uncharacterized protein